MANVGVIIKGRRLVMLDDVCEIKGRLVDSLEAEKNIVCKKKPHICPKCESNKKTKANINANANIKTQMV